MEHQRDGASGKAGPAAGRARRHYEGDSSTLVTETTREARLLLAQPSGLAALALAPAPAPAASSSGAPAEAAAASVGCGP